MDHCKRSQGSVWLPMLFICCLPLGRTQALRKSSEAMHRNCNLSHLCAMLIVSGICKVDPSGKDFFVTWKTDAPPRLSDELGREKEWRKGKKIQTKRKNKHPEKQLPLIVITLAGIDHPGSCLEWLLLQHYTLHGTPSDPILSRGLSCTALQYLPAIG